MPQAWALRGDAEQPIHIEGDDAVINQEDETIVYTGSVKIKQGTLTVTGERLVVKVEDEQVVRITTLGEPAHYTQQLEDNRGDVKAHADAIIYHTAAERVYLNGSAELEQQGNQLKGESIRYDIVNGKVDASSGETPGRVQMRLDPKITKNPDSN